MILKSTIIDIVDLFVISIYRGGDNIVIIVISPLLSFLDDLDIPVSGNSYELPGLIIPGLQ